ncbi:aminotransferase class I/II-fold pyridoxal phosphate-dependent enzyme [Streptomyces sp. JJ38]|uniref:aminotransferase class I/II-fold pyridoxal phosphate-dependent enzyme n=1 Tax=Streptomyces sp. JJ38 TaxID=2738128 RepID=UPI001C565A3F|nr:aminotransferase class I/II-fold pyridoxal phosphate-dependent enzyme [Streptomyces sp. JJ38]MBW1596026.1 aminotransferase class I/II-fold pyridoxal phosphate-dependent enzyme [Streptomyces sp. JJ38]
MRGDRESPDLKAAACGYWERRGLPTVPAQVVSASGAELLLLALLAVCPGGTPGPGGPRGVYLPVPGPRWHGTPARLLGLPVHPVPTPAECGGVPDPFALLEAVRRDRAAGVDPGVLLLSLVDDPTGTVPPPELLYEVCEAAVDQDLLIVSDESLRDTCHDPHGTVVVSPAEMLHPQGGAAGSRAGSRGRPVATEGAETADAEDVVVLLDLAAALVPGGRHTGLARFPGAGRGRAAADAVRRTLHTLAGPPGPDPEADLALSEPAGLRARREAAARTDGRHAAAVCRAVTAAGGLCRPPQAGGHLYPDLEPLRDRLARHGVTDAATLEAALVLRLGPGVLGGHRFGDDPGALRARLPVTAQRDGAQEHPPGAPALARVEAALAELTRTPTESRP